MRAISLLTVALIGLVAVPVLAQNPPPAGTPTRIRGTVEKLDGNTLTVKSRDGQTLTIKLAEKYAVSALVKETAADVKSNDYIASTGVKGADGKLHCVELRIFPEALRGVAEGQFPWDGTPNSTMTNATVTGIAQVTGGEVVSVKFKGNDGEFVVGSECAVYGYVDGDPGLLKPGAAIFAVALKKDDGSLNAARITAEKDGVKPPM